MSAVLQKVKTRPVIILGDDTQIPGWVTDLESFRRWAKSEEFPEHGWFSYLDGEIWVNLEMEQLFTHNQVKVELGFTIVGINKESSLGRYFADRVFLSHPGAGLSTEPDATFAAWDTIRSGRLRLVEGAREGYVELEGTPDMVLEVVSSGSVTKDTVRLRELYWRAGIPEFWLVDVRETPLQIHILRHAARGYVATRKLGGWLKSTVFGRSFRFLRIADDPLGHPLFSLEARP